VCRYAAAFNKWVEFTEESIEMKVKIKRALAKMMMRQAAQAFDRWAEMTTVGLCTLNQVDP
jgi:hypothetical protein